MAYDSKCFDLAQYFLGCDGDDGDEMQASLAQRIHDAVEVWFGERMAQREAGLTEAEQKAQGARCGCMGADDYCVCQNVPDKQTRAKRAAPIPSLPQAGVDPRRDPDVEVRQVHAAVRARQGLPEEDKP